LFVLEYWVTLESPSYGGTLSMADMNCLIAALVITALAIGIGFWVGLVSKLLLSKLLPVLGSLALTMIDFLSIAGVTWLLFRRLQPHYTSREAKAAATAFALLSPIMLAAAQFVGSVLMFYLKFYMHLPSNVSLAVAWMSVWCLQ
jgi:hypothetical protein